MRPEDIAPPLIAPTMTHRCTSAFKMLLECPPSSNDGSPTICTKFHIQGRTDALVLENADREHAEFAGHAADREGTGPPERSYKFKNLTRGNLAVPVQPTVLTHCGIS